MKRRARPAGAFSIFPRNRVAGFSLIPGFRIGLGIALALVLLGHPAPSMAARVEVSGSYGRANMTLQNRLGASPFESMSVSREAIGVSIEAVPRLRLGVELAWLQRGGGFPSTTVFRPDGDGFLRLERRYLELSLTASGAWTRGEWGLEVGVAPRLSHLTRKAWLGLTPLEPRGTILGLDPSISVSYDRFFVTARYLWDLQPSHEYHGTSGSAELDDTTWFIGMGLRLGR